MPGKKLSGMKTSKTILAAPCLNGAALGPVCMIPCPLYYVICLLVACLASQQHASVSQGMICSHNCTCCHTEIQVADQTFHLTQSQYDTRPTSPSADPITPGRVAIGVPIFKSLV